ncbi:family 43 glycosylhydrolase [Mucilaginibacter robiniae]|uniref:Family 43 glycosylhydrolase n=1 Tax=Mucilaginibacter robiniae TaxID=2728022 RepID=A0A7L5E0C9_9SPHI|nr:family 43 glycosylhydrolase [Mucilaginibacter robiniae]QJD94984.1 family 43 glycosylhydrolase [Mucilaginibacter robiniae]
MNTLYYFIVFMFLGFGSTLMVSAQTANIQNDVFWNTTDGRPIYSQGGGIFRFNDPASGAKKYYWYGVHYKEADAYRKDPSVTQKTSRFTSVTCYSSVDLVHWVFEGDVLTESEVLKNNAQPTWLGRLGVDYIKELKKYALIIQHGNQVLFAVADSPTSQFTWHQQIDMTSMIGTPNTGDQTVFTDEDTGKSYLIYSYGRGRNKIYVSEIGVKNGMVNLLDCTEVYHGEGREGNCMFKYQGRYYMCASDLYGWDASHAYYLVADNIRGPYTPANHMQVMNGCTDDYAHVTQTGFFYTVRGSKQETVIFCGDRWADFAGNGLGYNQWCPLSFDGQTPYFNSVSSWNLNCLTGAWMVSTNNNYVKNGSFEADRKRIPSIVKPAQEQLSGWVSVVLQGSPIHIDTISPSLNHDNDANDRKVVIGEKSLNISDRVDFQRKVYQTLSATPYVPLNDGLYTLTAKVKNSIGFVTLEMYAVSSKQTVKYNIKNENTAWQTIRIEKVPVKGGQVEIGFLAQGKANAFCYIDDVVLVKSR